MYGMNDGLVVNTAYGPYRGVRESGADVWKGIRFARAQRWRRATPPEPHTEVVDAAAFGPISPQASIPGMDTGTPSSEDCLFLNVWRPTVVTPGTVLPVMVWIHGGAYVLGAGGQNLYVGTRLALEGQVVIVTVNYRLGALGFADLTAFNEPGEHGFESNAAMSDVLAALTWVRENIAGFGGDSGRITVFGESAGAGIVTTPADDARRQGPVPSGHRRKFPRLIGLQQYAGREGGRQPAVGTRHRGPRRSAVARHRRQATRTRDDEGVRAGA